MYSAYRTLMVAFTAFIAAIWLLSWLARRYPRIAWLQPFVNAFPRPNEAQRARMRRRSNLDAGAQLILLGIALALGYGALTMMTFGDFGATESALVLAGAALCVGLGVTALWTNRRD